MIITLIRRFGWTVALFGLLAAANDRVEAAVLTEFTTGINTAATLFAGQSATTPAGGPFNNITFNFFSDIAGGTTPSAAGDLFILTQSYAGNPNALNSLTTGFLAQSTGISGGVYQFNSAVTLLGGTQYFFYANQAVLVSGANSGGYPGGTAYLASAANSPFADFSPGDANFRLSGTPVGTAAVPEPSMLLGGGVGATLAAAYAVGKRRRRGPRA